MGPSSALHPARVTGGSVLRRAPQAHLFGAMHTMTWYATYARCSVAVQGRRTQHCRVLGTCHLVLGTRPPDQGRAASGPPRYAQGCLKPALCQCVRVVQAWEQLRVQHTGSNKVAFAFVRRAEPCYLSARPDGVVLAFKRNEPLEWEEFTLMPFTGGRIGLRTHHGRFVGTCQRPAVPGSACKDNSACAYSWRVPSGCRRHTPEAVTACLPAGADRDTGALRCDYPGNAPEAAFVLRKQVSTTHHQQTQLVALQIIAPCSMLAD